MKKVLIWDKDTLLEDVGGPSGYLFKIHTYLEKNRVPNIVFYSDIIKRKHIGNKESIIKRIIKGEISLKTIIINIIIKLLPKSLQNVYATYFYSEKLTKEELKLISDFDYVHFHWISEIMKYKVQLKKINALNTKVILTTHSPEPFISEIMGTRLDEHKFIKDIFLEKESQAYKMVDYIMFPVPMAKEAYTENYPILAKTFNSIKDKFFYIPTAIESSININTEKALEYKRILSSYPFKVCFIGRHSLIKGYDKLKEIAKKCWSINPDIYFIIGGKESSIKRLSDNRWIELGWVDTYSLLENIDIFVLPNKQTYFDLILLEVLRQGVPCVISETGGNKWFTDQHIDGIEGYIYDDIETAAMKITEMLNYKGTSKWDEIKQNCKDQININHTIPNYLKRYSELLNSLS